ncbi:alpha/beta hydrolase [Pseudomonas nicosulfuronedens]|uniref:Alpha/beta hydrolase n=1 Tax=Pseudomonas nicosulfuronedens TaxID=2571105 RepID=A0A5R9QMM6_9PSED|nr:alpha/beta fold hydrolase [Pseudomonas nicosulfuronedens]MDH1009900.1 alpha/beta hydrolase [Pseudomonas nicosulfuronedens]MDH1978876.1 alpha/beta hydrolase [Pseudomonas nicosulfuronedens]MDH2028445.1 alpha/beta hydrolase [Pseudomonas nicosulfuronedens]TLX70811.1 alpha/beta hydrolase [Pseudomonas nicosulfuronedens]
MTQPLILEPSQSVDSCVIWLHGLGADRYDFEPVAQMLQRSFTSTRFILPQAPTRPVTVFNGMPAPSWYDILAMAPARAIDEAQLEASADSVIALIQGQIDQGIAAKRIILAGFSQGGAVVLHTGYLRWDGELGGVMALSTYGPTFSEGISLPATKRQLSALCLHGTFDDVVLPAMGCAAYDFLQANEVPAQWRTYPMSHEVSNEELGDIGAWLRERL